MHGTFTQSHAYKRQRQEVRLRADVDGHRIIAYFSATFCRACNHVQCLLHRRSGIPRGDWWVVSALTSPYKLLYTIPITHLSTTSQLVAAIHTLNLLLRRRCLSELSAPRASRLTLSIRLMHLCYIHQFLYRWKVTMISHRKLSYAADRPPLSDKELRQMKCQSAQSKYS